MFNSNKHIPLRKNRNKRAILALLETLEPRQLLSGLTVITHGYEPFSNDRPGWLDAMADAIKTRLDGNVSIYTLRLEPTNATTVHVSDFSRLYGPPPSQSSDDETILLLDWASVSGVITQTYSVTYLASVVTPYLTTAFPSIGLTEPLAEGSVQLIGHSRGAPFVSEIAKDLGQSGIWVDQVTTLDPVPSPFNNDPSVTLRSNVIFADNYYQQSGDGILVPNGSSVSGADNFGPLSLSGGYSILNGGTHNNVHLFYQGTILTTGNPSDGSATGKTSWYNDTTLIRTDIGFNLSRLGGATSYPSVGLSSAFGGSASRSSVTLSGPQWPNIDLITPDILYVLPGGDFTADFKFEDSNATSTVQWFLDPDTNPYNANGISVSAAQNFSATGTNVISSLADLTANAPDGTYHLEAMITNGSETRYSYALTTVTVADQVDHLVLTTQPANMTAGHFTQSLTVQVQGADGQVLTGDTSSVTLAIESGPATGSLSGTTTVSAIAGIATFSNLSAITAGNYVLSVSDDPLDPILTNSFSVVPDLSTEQIVLAQQSNPAVAGQSLSPAIILNVQDQYGNLITSNNTKVTLSIATGPTGDSIKGTTSENFKNGVATFSNITLTPAGNFTLRAADSSVAGNTPLLFPESITAGITTINTPKVAASYTFGKNFSLTALLTSNAPTSIHFTGNATLVDNLGDTLAIAPLSSGGQAKFNLESLPAGSYNATINYPGDPDHTSATSSPFTILVTLAGTSTSLSVSPGSLVVGESVTLKATVNASSGSSTPRTGTVSFYDGITLLAAITLDSHSSASVTLPDATLGVHNFTAVYSGDANFNLSDSSNHKITVGRDRTQTTLTFDGPVPLFTGDSVTLNASVAVLAPGAGTPTGNITFKDGSHIIGTAILDDTSAASMITSFTSSGSHHITAIYSGDDNSNASTSLSLNLSVTLTVV